MNCLERQKPVSVQFPETENRCQFNFQGMENELTLFSSFPERRVGPLGESPTRTLTDPVLA